MSAHHDLASPRRNMPAIPATATVVDVHGELDIFTSHALRERLLRALADGPRQLVCDLSDMTFCDASGLAVFVGAQRRARSMGITFGLAAPREQVRRLLRITGLDRALTVYPLVPAARTVRDDGDVAGTAAWTGVPSPR